MKNRLMVALAVATAGASGAAILHAQGGPGGGEWTTSGFDAQRTRWVRSDPRITRDAMQKPGEFGTFKFLWKLKLEHDPQAPTMLTEPVLLDRLIGFRGFKSIAFVATASETVHAIDIDFGVPLWKYHVNYSASPPPVLGGPPACPGGLTSAVSRPTAISPLVFGGGGGRGARSGGGVGEPGRGATTLATSGRGQGAGPAPPPAAPPAAPPGTVPGSTAAAAAAPPGTVPASAAGAVPGGAGAAGLGGGGGGGFVPGSDAAYVVGSDGYLHALNVSNGWDNMTPALFLPANTRAMGLIVATATGGRVAYAATTHGCGSQPDAVWAMDLASPQRTVVAFKAGGATIAGTAGPTFGRDGTVYVSTTDGRAMLSNSVIALDPRTLKVKASVTIPKADFSSSPLVFPWKDKDSVAAAGGGKLFLFDAASLESGPLASAPFATVPYETGALVSWLDGQGTRWIAVPSARRIETFKVVEQEGKAALQRGWTSRAIAAPLKPIVINGVLFAASSGSRTAPAVLYAIDAATGKDLWNSGGAMTSPARGGLSGGQGNVYVPGSDGTLYAFGFEIPK
jgi:outer membrane protein assembly factor BamB